MHYLQGEMVTFKLVGKCPIDLVGNYFVEMDDEEDFDEEHEHDGCCDEMESGSDMEMMEMSK